ncbi:TPA: hypothetical protein QDC03_001436 [Burkholderia cepacia]|uniref:hypothetical protein n=1 Tax=Burkholderia TaxID=32008 RepID=UPI000A4178DC|nr:MULTISPECIES: hypothetical protein [Burkholderia cepacia complex]EKS9885336.1 hypothetical protein [Burkholderia pyrrocinia]EKS9892179.1 hypothetical protein [Burkholderia pyrrocinia]EKS9906540.1 hypothetical protein [Burkholderia pyrrocinia]HDR9506386.1 hypothetical protein [Burkholderia cepacia]
MAIRNRGEISRCARQRTRRPAEWPGSNASFIASGRIARDSCNTAPGLDSGSVSGQPLSVLNEKNEEKRR